MRQFCTIVSIRSTYHIPYPLSYGKSSALEMIFFNVLILIKVFISNSFANDETRASLTIQYRKFPGILRTYISSKKNAYRFWLVYTLVTCHKSGNQFYSLTSNSKERSIKNNEDKLESEWLNKSAEGGRRKRNFQHTPWKTKPLIVKAQAIETNLARMFFGSAIRQYCHSNKKTWSIP